ncbi:sulfotransferase [Mycobacterium sp. ITM-2016-00317]|uniref:sulfotransferase family protein n=1 Tax=Mycobacterium sp. ITM-2016-00317 TaxID=2099694 RepID=UPI00287FBE0D|nr:sulfotransferase [Mycobacterium sp. ITM-2016-00317]WNG89240.1 sulfotransferase [Mycobacterium sp. ITM-2016-00317]
MSWQPSPRSAAAREMYCAAEQDRLDRPQRYTLDPETVLDRMAARGEVTPEEFAPGWRDGLEMFLASAQEEGRLNAVGVRTAVTAALGRLSAGATIRRCHQHNPAAGDNAVRSPIVITGGWRTGTTFLFRLLGRDPRLHAPLPAELVAPWAFTTPSARKPAKAAAARTSMLHTLNPAMAVVHPSGPDLPEECVLAMGTDMRNWGFTSMFRVPKYADWLGGQDFAEPYARYREILQLLELGDDRRFVLKAPAHMAELDHVASTFPGAVVIQLHRDIVTTIASGASLFAVYQSTYSDAVDPVDVGRRQVEQSERWFRRAVAFRSSAHREQVTLIDVAYRDLVDRPESVLERIYAAADMPPPADLKGFVADYHRAHPRDGQAGHRYTPHDFGLDPAQLRDRFSFLPYD